MSFHRSSAEVTERRDPMQEFADRIVAALEKGVKPWVKPWNPLKCGGNGPHNPVTQHFYRGINILILGTDDRAFESGDPRWVTYQQAKEKGWQVKKGERSTPIFFTKQRAVDEEDNDFGEKKIVRILKHYAVFHASQIEGIPVYLPPTIADAPWARPDAADIILKNSGATLRIGGAEAFYSSKTDHIQLPPESAFRGAPDWATTALHELSHWTGHSSRLNRDLTKRYGSASYAMEELRAELASAFLANELGIPAEIPDHASYIEGWLKPLKSDKRVIFQAAADAQRIVDLILSYHPDYVAQAEPSRPEPGVSASRIAPAIG